MIIDVVMFKVFNGSVSNDAEQERQRRCCGLHYAVETDLKRYLVVEVLEQVGLRWLAWLLITPQLVCVVVFERSEKLVQEVEHLAGRLIGELRWIDENEGWSVSQRYQ